MQDWVCAQAQGHYKALYGSSCSDRKADPKWRGCHDMAKADAEAIDWVYPDKIVSNVIDFSTPTQFTNSFDEEVVVTKGRKRDQRVVNHVKKMYSQCAVDGCDYPLFDVAHIHALKHGADDLPGNCIPLCPNHHRDLDRGRLLLADPSDRSASDPIEFLMNGEVGQIILGGGHEVDNQYINGCIYEIASWSANAKPIT